GGDEYETAIAGRGRIEKTPDLVFTHRLHHRARNRPIVGAARPHEPRGTELLLGHVDDAVNFAAGIVARLRNHEPAHGAALRDDLLEHAEVRFAKRLAQILDLEPRA